MSKFDENNKKNNNASSRNCSKFSLFTTFGLTQPNSRKRCNVFLIIHQSIAPRIALQLRVHNS